MYPFYAEIVWMWYEDGKRTTNREAIFLMADSYANAAGKIEEDYGEELDHIEHLECINDGRMLCSVTKGREILKIFQEYEFAEIVDVKEYS